MTKDAATDRKVDRLLRAGRSVPEIADATGRARRVITARRNQLGLPPHRPGHTPPTLAELIKTRTRPAGDGHLIWTGVGQPPDSVPLAYHQGVRHTAYQLVWCLRTGAWPSGIVHVACDESGCVAFEHLVQTPRLTMGDFVDFDRLRQMIAERTEPAESGGHLRWTGYQRDGVPILRYGSSESNYQTTAARFVWYLHTGREPRRIVRRTCGFPACMAFTHLTDSTKKDIAA